MNIEQLNFQEKVNTGTSQTNNHSFDENGYLVVKNLWDSKELFCEVPKERGQFNYFGNVEQFQYSPIEAQVNGSLSRYSHPQYKYIHSQIRLKLEKFIGKKLYNTYYYDRFYFSEQELTKHLDRDACEISVSVHIGSNLKKCWPLWIKSVKGDEKSICLSPGDGLVYKGCERPHWREKMPEQKFLFFKKKNIYYHQIFFHYVLADGQRAHCAFDMAR